MLNKIQMIIGLNVTNRGKYPVAARIRGGPMYTDRSLKLQGTVNRIMDMMDTGGKRKESYQTI